MLREGAIDLPLVELPHGGGLAAQSAATHIRLSSTTSSRSMAEAGRRLFAVSGERKKVANDADRIRKYLGSYELSWADVSG
jgi:sigma54-dependent transcription regulator